MTITDIFTFVGIAVSIIFGSFVSRFSSIRDTRTRTIKSHYIEQIKIIKGRIDKIFHQLIFGKSSFKKFVKWYSHIELDIDSVDDGIRKCLDVQMDKFGDVLEQYYNEITGWSDFNDKYRMANYMPSPRSRELLCSMKYQLDDFLNDYIQHVNQSSTHNIISEQWNKYKQYYSYHKEQGAKMPRITAIKHRISQHIIELLTTISLIVAFVWLYGKVEKVDRVNLTTPLNKITSKLDTISSSINLFKEKYEPLKVQTKTFHNSTFFNANEVDSLEIKIYQGEKDRLLGNKVN